MHVDTKFTLPLLITESACQESPSPRHRKTLVVGSPSEKLGISEGVCISQGLAVVIRLRQRRGVGRLFLLVLLSARRNCSKPRFEDTPPDFARAGRTLFFLSHCGFSVQAISKDLTGSVAMDRYPVDSGGSADIYDGKLRGSKVSINSMVSLPVVG